MAAAYNKFDCFTQDMVRGLHDFAVDTFKIMLTNTLPVRTNALKADIAEITPEHGYAAGGSAITLSDATLLGVETVSGANLVFTAAGGSFGPLRYAVLYNSSAAGQPLVAWFDYGASTLINDTETITVKPDAINGLFTVT